ncbi:hypothetical protein [Peribacillus glennii]|uniref:Uncharacterized protein n=1 Tax=Peribacillus glennii TaxID=2303991 RepID=A0A372L6P9_9BACI|nr:hypothetical protein [Peribacillus glennii]RFU60770.1 hypothetical protein D0466_20680 [Peribacillus glennii]
MVETVWEYKTLKEYDHLELAWVRGEGYNIYNKNAIAAPLAGFGEDKAKAIKEFDKMVLHYLKKQIG